MTKTDDTQTEDGKLDNPFALFETDQEVEQKGVELDYGAFYFTIARAGGANSRYKKVMAAKTKPFRRLIQEGRMPEAKSKELMHEAVAETVVLGWGSKKHGHGKMIGKQGEAIDFTHANVIKLFNDLPDMFQDLWEQANSVALFRATEEEEDAGNSPGS